MKRYKLHPIVKSFALMSDESYQELLADAREHGIRIPAIIWNGLLIDGANRQKAADELGIELPVTEFDGTELEAVKTAIAANAIRRHETPDQKAISANLCIEIIAPLKEAAEKRRLANLRRGNEAPEATSVSSRENTEENGSVRSQLAGIYGVSEGKISQGKQLLERDRNAAMAVLAGNATIAQAKALEKEAAQTAERRQQNKRVKRATPPDVLKQVNRYRLIIVGTEWVNHFRGDWLEELVNEWAIGRGHDESGYADDDCLLLMLTDDNPIIEENARTIMRQWGFKAIPRHWRLTGMEKFTGQLMEEVAVGVRGKVEWENIVPRAALKCGKDGPAQTLLDASGAALGETKRLALHFAGGKTVVNGAVNWPLEGEPVAT